VVKEELGQEGQVLAVDRVLVAIDFENCNFRLFVSVDLISRRMKERTNLGVPFEFRLESEEAEAKITYIEAV